MTVERLLLVAIILILPFQFALNVASDIDLAISRIFIPGIFVLWLARSLAKRKIFIAWKAETFLVCMFLFFTAVTLYFALDRSLGMRKLFFYLSIFPVYFVAADISRSRREKTHVLRAITFAGLLVSITGILQFLLQFFWGLKKTLAIWKSFAGFFLGKSFGELVISNSSWLVNVSGRTILRAFAFFPDPHMFAFFVSLAFFAILGYAFEEKSSRWKLFATISSVAAFVAVILSFSRGAWLAMTAGIFFFLVVTVWRSPLRKEILAVAGVAVIASMLLFPGAVQKRFSSSFDLQEGSNSERLKNWKQALEVVRIYPLVGIGLGNYSSYVDPQAGERSSIYAHNTFLDISAESGIISGLIFLMLIFTSFLRNVFSGEATGLGLASAMVYFFVHGIFDTALFSPQVMVLFLVIVSLGVGAPKLQAQTQNAEIAS